VRGRLERSVAGQAGGAASRRQGDEDEQVRRRDEQRKQNDERDQRRCDAVRGVNGSLMCAILCLQKQTQHYPQQTNVFQ